MSLSSNIFVTIITGLSGSGKTVALRSLEDCGYFCTDNLPPALIDEFLTISSESDIKTIAIGIDIREKRFLSEIDKTVRKLKERYAPEIVFLEAEKDTLVRRFKETRRPHPLTSTHGSTIEKAIEREIGILKPLKDAADRIIDTTPLSPHQLRDMITSIYCGAQKKEMKVVLTSFGYKFGVPQQADLIFDVRFLPNPHFIPELQPLTGKEKPVRDFVLQDKNSLTFISKLKDMLDFLIPLFMKEGKSYLNICIGCTGGKHRSVALVGELSTHLKQFDVTLEVVHREL